MIGKHIDKNANACEIANSTQPFNERLLARDNGPLCWQHRDNDCWLVTRTKTRDNGPLVLAALPKKIKLLPANGRELMPDELIVGRTLILVAVLISVYFCLCFRIVDLVQGVPPCLPRPGDSFIPQKATSFPRRRRIQTFYVFTWITETSTNKVVFENQDLLTKHQFPTTTCWF